MSCRLTEVSEGSLSAGEADRGSGRRSESSRGIGGGAGSEEGDGIWWAGNKFGVQSAIDEVEDDGETREPSASCAT